MDRLAIDARSPQEDEFALLSLGIPSVYRGFVDPRRLPELTQWLDPGAWTRDRPKGWLRAWQRFLAMVSPEDSARLVLKSPGHTFRIRALMDAFPSAAYLWIARDPAELLASNRKMWTAMFRRYALWDADTAALDEFLSSAFGFAAQCLAEAAKAIPRRRLAVMTFAELTEHPLRTLSAVNSRLHLGEWVAMEQPLAASARTDYRPDKYEVCPPTVSVSEAMGRLRSAQQDALATHGLEAC